MCISKCVLSFQNPFALSSTIKKSHIALCPHDPTFEVQISNSWLDSKIWFQRNGVIHSICGPLLLPIVFVCYSSLINRFPDYGALTDLSDQLYPMEDKVCSQSVKTRSKRYPVCSHVWKNGKELKFPVFRLFNWSILWWRQMFFILQSAKIWSPDDYSMVQLTI